MSEREAVESVRTALAMNEAGYNAQPKLEDVATLLWDYDRVALRASSAPAEGGEVERLRAKLADGPWRIEPHRDNPYNVHVVDADGHNVVTNCGRAFGEYLVAVTNALSARPATLRRACQIARPLLADEVAREIEGNALAETKKREGSIKRGKLFYHEDTIDEFASLEAIRIYRAALKAIDRALNPQQREGK